ncbi:FAD-binding domain-containing protein, partial [Auriculariales sp. MPI-PUGE-AT-0066]
MVGRPLRVALSLAFSFAISSPADAKVWCKPGNPCFPGDDILATFNTSVGGALIRTVPYAAVCYAGEHYNAAACEELVTNQKVKLWRHQVPTAVMYTNWEFGENGTASEPGCLTPETVPNAPLTGTCVHGAQAPFVVNATTPETVQKSVQFAKKYNLRLRVKNSGHCYMGRSSAVGSFTIWTYYMQGYKLQPTFVADQCANAAQSALEVGPGTDVQGLYAAGFETNRTTIGGFTTTVGAAGGYILGGGTGPLSNRYGLGVDNVLQYQIVTADGSLRIANACQNADLFWALRGGGGAFGVTTRVWIKAHPAFQAVNFVKAVVIAPDLETHAKVVRALVDLSPNLLTERISGIWQTRLNGLSTVSVPLRYLSSTVVPANDTYHALDSLWNITGITVIPTVNQYPTWFEGWKTDMLPIIETGSIVGVNLLDMSRIVQTELLQSDDGRKRMADSIMALPTDVPFIWQLNTGGKVLEVGPEETSINPIWRNSQGFVDFPIFGPQGAVVPDQQAKVDQVRVAATEVFGAPSYYNENVPGETNWQESFWGTNYPRLLQLKLKWDPTGVISCRQCVGSEIFG